jgi:hypothetical protein
VYRFAGFFAKPLIDQPASLPEDAVWRSISLPFTGVGVRLPALIGESPAPSEVRCLLQQVGLHAATDWLYITYDCWAGRIDYVYGLGVRSDHTFGPVKEADISKVKTAYVELPGEFGVQPDDAIQFAPFERGYWGNA